ncbi:MAG TPA: glycerophosphodiester phosphodiesterase family protein [Allosphingosinicella sp.]|nr:glycerophosphodiester phosphodiesterase family protein [Allosphingosinicella sp.]
MPSSQSREAELRALIARPFAHRGLHGAAAPENSRAAFEAAIEARHGIELDVQVSGDKRAMVFHDEELGRLAEDEGYVRGRSAAELGRIRLRDSEETIPTLQQILALIAGRAPLLIEAKAPGREVGSLCRAIADALGDYGGPAAVMSFNPEVGHWFARHEPKWLRGLVVTERRKKWRGGLARRLSAWRSKADFLAYDIRDLPSRFAEAQRRGGLRVLTWTVRSLQDRAKAAQHADQIIYEDPAR